MPQIAPVIRVASSWGIDGAQHAKRVIAEGQMDLVKIGRATQANPHYPYERARQLGVERPSCVPPAPHAHGLERYSQQN